MKYELTIRRIIFFTLIITAVIQTASCKKEKVQNQKPLACAGHDQTVLLPASTGNLDGRCSTDPEKNISEYKWTKISGPAPFNIVKSTSANTQVTHLVQGTYQFELKVTDNKGIFSKDTVQVWVKDPPLSTNNLSFWTNEGNTCLCTGDGIFIMVNNTTRLLSAYFYGPPVTNCDDKNAIGFTLLPGTYSWLAVRDYDTARGSVVVSMNSCVVQEIKF